MGYYETPCQLCSVSFKIGRYRTQSEPRHAAWAPSSNIDPAIRDDRGCGDAGYMSTKCFQRGCKLVGRECDERARYTSAWPKDEIPEEFSDVLPSGVDTEGKEVSLEAYMSWRYMDTVGRNGDRLPPGLNVQDVTSEVRKGSYQVQGFELEGHVEAYLEWFRAKIPQEHGQHEWWSKSYTQTDWNMIEHIAGPDCVGREGYNGNLISAEEMRPCTTLQCVVDKRGDAHDFEDLPPEPDDEDFERSSSYFLSGLAERCGSWEDLDDATVYPRRHNVSDINPIEYEGFDLGDKPVHPYCLEIYKRVSLLRQGKTDLVSLFDWWAADNSQQDIPWYPVEGGGQWWEHHAGAEVLVAYPLESSALNALFEAARRPLESFNARNSPFPADTTSNVNSSDPFHRLPSELRDMTVASLGSKDIANLRLASRSFRHLPNTLWHDLLQKEMPWIWEAWTDRPYAFMACTTRRDLEAHDKAIEARFLEAEKMAGEQKEIQEAIITSEDASFRQPRPVQDLPRLHTDWHQLYTQLQREWQNIKGLQNRERIWKGLEFVLRRVRDHEEDVDAASLKHRQAFPYRFAFKSARKGWKFTEEA